MRYEIKQGDTLSEIAQKFGQNYLKLASHNNIDNPDYIRAGQIIDIPTRDIEAQVQAVQQAEPEVVKQAETRRRRRREPKPKEVREVTPTNPRQNRTRSTAAPTESKARSTTRRSTKEVKQQSLLRPDTSTKTGFGFNFIPENAVAFVKFLVGNKLGIEAEGEDIDVGEFGERQKEVLRTVVANARKRGSTKVTYEDYPLMADGQVVDQYYKKNREEANLYNLAKASFQDPVFEMFTTLGVFNFKDLEDGRTEILPDHYGFSKKKSGGANRPKATDTYGKLTHLGQDISENQTYNFNVFGII